MAVEGRVTTPAGTGRRYSRRAVALFRLLTGLHAALYRLTGGRIGGRVGGAPVLLLTTRGRKSGRARTVPLLYLADGDTLVIVGSAGNGARHPRWWSNLRAQPTGRVRSGRRSLRVIAETAGPAERERLWPRLVALFPRFAEMQARTTRELPVVILRPLPSEASSAR